MTHSGPQVVFGHWLNPRRPCLLQVTVRSLSSRKRSLANRAAAPSNCSRQKPLPEPIRAARNRDPRPAPELVVCSPGQRQQHPDCVSIMPQSLKSGDTLHFIAIEDLLLTCTVLVYAVAVRERSAAANDLIRLLRSADWSRLLPFRPEPARPPSVHRQ
jgi:hypothetical protein